MIDNYRYQKIPVDVIWSDIDYMDHYQDFTINHKQYRPMRLNKWIEHENLKYVPIIDAGIAIGDNDAYDIGLEDDLFIKNSEGKPLLGHVWPGKVHYPDFFNPNTSAYWSGQLDSLKQMVNFTGIWLDMNEVSNFCDGECEEDPVSTQKHSNAGNIGTLVR